MTYNGFLNYKGEDRQTVVEMAYPDNFKILQKFISLSSENKLNILEVDQNEISLLIDFISDINFSLEYNCCLKFNSEFIRNLIPISFILKICSLENYAEGCKNFEQIIKFEECLLEYFMEYHFNYDLNGLDKFESVNIESLTPISRADIRRINYKNNFFTEKYLNENFNLLDFTFSLMDRYLPIKTYKIPNRTFIYGLKIFKNLLEHGIFMDESISTNIIEILFIKLENFSIFESTLQQSEDLKSEWSNKNYVINDLINEIRTNLACILISALFMKFDDHLFDLLRKLSKKTSKFNNLENLLKDTKFDQHFIFQSDFWKKVIHIYFGYILSCEISNPYIFDKELIKLTDKILMFTSNINDQFLSSFKLMDSTMILNFLEENEKNNTSISKFNTIKKRVSQSIQIISKSINSEIFESEIESFINIFDNLNSKHLEDYSENELFDFQDSMLNSGLFCNLFAIAENLLESKRKMEMIEKYSNLMKLFLWKNSNNQFIFLQDYYFSVIRTFVSIHPYPVIKNMAEIFSYNPKVLKANEDYLNCFFGFHEVNRPTRLIDDDLERVKISIEILKILEIYSSETSRKDHAYLPEFDIKVGDHLSLLMRDRFNINDYKQLMSDSDIYPSIIKEHAILFSNILRKSLRYRFTRKAFDAIKDNINLENIKEIVNNLDDFTEKEIFLELFTHINVDFKNNLLNQRNNFFIRRPVDMQYDEDINYARPYNEYIVWFLDEIIRVFKLAIDRNSDKEFLENARSYIGNGLLLPLFKTFNLYSLIKDNDLSQIKHYLDVFKKANDIFFHETKVFNEFFQNFGLNLEISKEIKEEKTRSKLEIYRCKDDYLKERLKIKYFVKKIIYFVNECLKCCNLNKFVTKMNHPKHSSERVASRKIDILMCSNLKVQREEGRKLLETDLRSKLEKKGIDLMSVLTVKYQLMKHSLLSSNPKENLFIDILNNNSLPESTIYSHNISFYLHNELKKDYTYGHKTYFYRLVETFTHLLYFATNNCQQSYYKIITSLGQMNSLDKIYLQMKFIMNYLKHKNTIDKYYKETYYRTLLCLKFHQFLCIDNCIEFKELFKDKILPDDSVDRVQRFTTIYQRTTDLCEFHNNYIPNTLTSLIPRNRSHLMGMCAYAFDCLAEFTAGPYEPNQMKIYRYIYDRYNGTLKRYMKDPNSDFYDLKESLCNFITAMSDGLNDEVVNFLTINYEVKTLNDLLINSIAQLYYDYKLRHNLTKEQEFNSQNDYPLFLSDYETLLKAFNEDNTFRSHTLLNIAVKIYKFMIYVSHTRTKFKMHMDDRYSELKKNYVKGASSFEERDLVSWKFLKFIVCKIEFVNFKGSLDEIFYIREPKYNMISTDSKNNFLDKIDRTSYDSKIASLIELAPSFEDEQDYHEKLFKNDILAKSLSKINLISLSKIIIVFCLSLNIGLWLKIFRKNDDGLFFINFLIGFSIIEILSLSLLGIFVFFKVKFGLYKLLQCKTVKDDKCSQNVKLLVSSWEFLIFAFHILMILLGTSVSQGFFAFELLAISISFKGFAIIGSIIKKNIRRYIGVLVLGILTISAYSIFMNHFVKNQMGEKFSGKAFKGSKYFFIMRIVSGLFQNPYNKLNGIKTIFADDGNSQENTNIMLLVYGLEISIFIFINLVLFNIMFAITLESLKEIRKQNSKKKYDQENVCFICNTDRYIIEKTALSFKDHIKYEHNLWNYLAFILQLRSKTTKDCTTKESFILQHINEKDYSWIPFVRSNSLGLFSIIVENRNFTLISEKKSEVQFRKLVERIDNLEMMSK